MRRLWLIFAQAVTVSVAVLFVVQTLKPEWLAGRPAVVSTSPAGSQATIVTAPAPASETRAAFSFADAAKHALPAVVHIYTTQEVRRHPLVEDPLFRYFFGDRFEQPHRRTGLGSGVVVSGEGYILTNNHVVEQADEIEVALQDGRRIAAKLVGTDPETDLAVLIVAAGGKLPAITFASPDSLAVGDVVLAIGNPFGVGQTVTQGIVSALERSQLGINTFENFIQTDAAINRGNSGGALVDIQGNLVGINTAIYSPTGASSGIGFAIPVSLARSIMEQIIQTGSVTRGWIGVEVQEITPELAESFKLPTTQGALIAGVMRDSPADRAGIKPGDILVAVAGRPLKDPHSMLGLVSQLKPGQNARFKLRRNGSETEVEVSIGKRPALRRSSE